MERNVMWMILFLLSLAVTKPVVAAQSGSHPGARIIEYPDYECKKSGILNIERITIDGDSTRVDFLLKSKPGYFGTVGKNTRLRDNASSVEYLPVRAEGIEFDKAIRTKKDSVVRYSLFYEALPATIKKIDMLEGTWDIFGIRLDGEKAAKPARVKNPESLIVTKKHSDTPAPIFSRGRMTISGIIDSYDPRAYGDLIQVNLENCIGQKRLTTNIHINPDGSFSKELDMLSSGELTLLFTNIDMLSLYAEPGEDLFIYVDPEIMKLRQAGVKTDKPTFSFGGSLGEINNGIINAPKYRYTHPDEKLSQQENHQRIDNNVDKWAEKIENYISANPSLHPIAVRYLRSHVISFRATNHLDYLMDLKYSEKADTTLTLEVFSKVLPPVFAADSIILTTSHTSSLMNRIAFCKLPEYSRATESKTINFDTAEIRRIINDPKQFTEPQSISNLSGSHEVGKSSPIATFNPVSHLPAMFRRIENRMKAIMKFVGLTEVPLFLQANEAAYACNYYRPRDLASIEETMQNIDSLRLILRPELRDAVTEYYAGLYDTRSYHLSDTGGGKILKSILAPYKGKAVIVDFWTLGCGPCRSEIEAWKEFRDKNRMGKDYVFIFITNDEESREEPYEAYVAKNLTNDITLRIPYKDFQLIKEELNFNSYPRKILIDPEGRVADPDFSFFRPYNLAKVLQKFGIAL
ncbi:MAG: TlpA family protein disulfide reductase [Bacteroides sp.]|nr:TlpA family protein disulfide reductase [Bacteroides sp.]MCM1390034.1 TlpA family protein disulfide reductase [Bacteroides sp.]